MYDFKVEFISLNNERPSGHVPAAERVHNCLFLKDWYITS